MLDASALIAYLRHEPGADAVATVLRDTTSACVAHRMNLLEVYYDVVRQADSQTAKRVLTALKADGVSEATHFSWPFLRRVGMLKAVGRYRSPTASVLFSHRRGVVCS